MIDRLDIDRTCVGGDRWKKVIPGQIHVFIPPGLVLT